MAFQPLTYSGQYPPLDPRSPSDVRSFDLLHTSLRAQPELAREGDKILNEEMLAKLVDGMRRFQRDHLGRKAKSKYWPTLRLPDVLFSDRSSSGPLATAILSAFRIKQTSPWRNFNFDNPKLFDDNIAIIKKIYEDLINRGFLKRPVLYFDDTVKEGFGPAEVARLTKIAQRFGATVVEDVKDVVNGRVTHIVAYDPEEHDAKDVIEEEERREKEGEELERTYLKTLALVDMPVEADDEDANVSGKMMKSMALVHWWYHPSSYDEWMAAEDVSGEVEKDEHPGIPGGPAVVGCKFVRDVEKFNEWGVEADYAVMEYERKIAYLRKDSNKASSASSSKKSKKRASKPVLEHSDEDHVAPDEPSAKRKKLHKDHSTEHTALSEMPSSPPNNASPNRTSSGKSKSPTASSKSGLHPNTTQTNTATSRQTSERRRPEETRGKGAGGMNPRRILTGIRSNTKRNEVLRRTVYDGALRVGEEPYKIIKEALGDYLFGGGSVDGKGSHLIPPTLNARPEWRKLLPPTGFIRPSVDASLDCMLVTELTLSTEVSSAANEEETKDASTASSAVTTIAVHQSVPILTLPTAIGESKGEAGEEPVSIRGGGDGMEVEDSAAGVGAVAPQQEQDAASSTQLPRKNEDAAQPAAAAAAAAEGSEGSESRKVLVDLAGNANKMETPGTVKSVGATPAETPVDNVLAEPKVDAMDGVEKAKETLPPAAPSITPAPVVPTNTHPPAAESARNEGGVEPSVSMKPPEVQAVGMAATDKETAPQPMPTAPVTAAKVGRETVSTEAPSLESKLIGANDSSAVKKNGEDGADDKNTDKPLESSGSQGPAANDHAVKDSSPAKLTSEGVTTMVTSTPSTANVASNTAPKAAVAEVSSSAVKQAPVTETPEKQKPPPATIRPVVPLPAGTQLSSSLHRPSSTANTEGEDATKNAITAPSWYKPSHISDLERRTLPEWFNSTAPHRTPTSYIQTREKILELSKRNPHQFITPTALRRSVSGDAGSLLRFHNFLMDWGMLNGGQVGETAPSQGVLRGLQMKEGALAAERKKRKADEQKRSSFDSNFWNPSRMQALEESVVKHVSQQQTTNSAVTSSGSNQATKMMIDWSAVAAAVGGNVTPENCQRAFIEPPTTSTADAANKMINSTQSMLAHLLDGVDPDVLKTTINASLQSTLTTGDNNNIAQAQKVSSIAAVASATASKGIATEDEIQNILMDIINQRLERLENRTALLDDVEALLEAERVSLELERRDMYTARCRHWFGDGS